MKKLIAIALILSFINFGNAYSQSCLPDGITFTTQSQIDNFPTLYPSCIEIEGKVKIEGDDIVNLNGLNAIVSIEGSLLIYSNDILTNLSGINNLEYVAGGLEVHNNPALTSLEGINSLYSVGLYVFIDDNSALINLSGLNSLAKIEEHFMIVNNDALESLYGLSNLAEVGTMFEVMRNDALETLSGLESLSSVGYMITISENISLTSIEGLSNLSGWSGGIIISKNPLLNNLNGLENITSAGVDPNFPAVGIYDNDILFDFSGLDNIITLTGGLYVSKNNSLQNFGGLNSLSSIEGSIYISENPVLSNIERMIGVTSIGSELLVIDNPQLKSLKGLDNIVASSMSGLLIEGNDLLSECEVKSICDYLDNPGGYTSIDSNDTGCNSQQEIELACESAGIDEGSLDVQLSVYPNPFTTSTTIEFALDGKSKIQISIYNTIGQPVYQFEDYFEQGNHKVTWSPSHLPAGMYYGMLRTEEEVSVVKMVKE